MSIPRNRRALVAVLTLALVGLVLASGALARGTRNPAEDLVARGEYLVKIIGCNDCHTPWIMTEHGPGPGMTRMLSGHPKDLVVTEQAPLPADGPWGLVGSASMTAWSGPWGISYAANLTPDPNTGTGIWTEDMFLRAIRTGKHWGQSRPIMPPMPWEVYRNMTDEDLKAIWAYLRTIPPIENRVPDYRPPGASGDE